MRPENRHFLSAARLILGCILTLAAVLGPVQAQPQLQGKVKGFTVSPEFYPNSAQMKSLLKGAEAEPLANNKVRLTEARLQTFRGDGSKELLMLAEECLYDQTGKIANSAGGLKASTEDGSFTMSGRGFAWEQTPGRLHISNQVHTVIQATVLELGETSPVKGRAKAGPTFLVIESDQFSYFSETQIGIYSGNVRVAGTNLALASDSLEIKVPLQERKFQAVTAKGRVQVRYGGISATGQTADYDANTGLLHVNGQPAWEARGQKGGGDSLQIDRTNQTFQAHGNSWLRLPGQTLGDFSLDRSTNNSATPKTATNQFIEIRASSYTFHTNYATFAEPVRVEEFQDDRSQSVLTCEQLTARFTGTNELSSILAEGQARIERANSRFLAGTALFTASNRFLWLTNQPRWESGPRRGSADLLLVDGMEHAMTARGHARMTLPASELAQTATFLDPSRTNAPLDLGDKPAEITCFEYRLSAESAFFRERVQLRHPQINWRCEQLWVRIPPPGGRVEALLAKDAVAFEVLDGRGQKVNGSGDKAVYSYQVTLTGTNDLMELTGNPATLEVTEGAKTNATLVNSVFVLNLATGQLVGPGAFTGLGYLPGNATNLLRFPDLK